MDIVEDEATLYDVPDLMESGRNNGGRISLRNSEGGEAGNSQGTLGEEAATRLSGGSRKREVPFLLDDGRGVNEELSKSGRTNGERLSGSKSKPDDDRTGQEPTLGLSDGSRRLEMPLRVSDGPSVSDGSSSSVAELSALDEYQMRTSLRPIKDSMTSPTVFRYSENRDVSRDTPDSTASSSKRFFTNTSSGEIREFRTSGLQESMEASGSSQSTGLGSNMPLAKSTRQLIVPAQARNQAQNQAYSQPQETVIQTKDLPSRQMATNQHDDEFMKNNRCLPKFLMFVVVLLVVVAGLVAIVVIQKDTEPAALPGPIQEDEHEGDGGQVAKECPDVELKLREKIRVNCSVETRALKANTLLIVPPPYAHRGENITVVLNSDTGNEWSGSLTALTRQLYVSGPEATCASPGTYLLMFMDQSNASVYAANVTINVISEVLQVNVTLNQSDSSNDFTLGCSTRSGCEKSSVDFFAEINKEENLLRGVNFTCTIQYNDYDGYSVSCVGTIPDFLLSQFESITCRPSSNLLANQTDDAIAELERVLELPECDISKHCGHECKEEGDYFIVSSGRCDIFHRCHNRQVYTAYCAPGTFFDPTECSCRHVKDLQWCQENGALKPDLYKEEKCVI